MRTRPPGMPRTLVGLAVAACIGMPVISAGHSNETSQPQSPSHSAFFPPFHPGITNVKWSTATVMSAAINSAAPEGCPIESPDGLSLFFASARAGGVTGNVGNDIWVSDRDNLNAPWQPARNLGEPVNSIASDFCPTPVGRSLFFVSERLASGSDPAPCGGGDMYLSRQSPAGGWSKPAMLGCAPNGPNFPTGERSPSLVEAWFGTFLFYSSSGNGGDADIYVSQMRADGTFGPGKVVTELSVPGYDDIMPNVRVRDDGSFEVVYSSNRPTWGHGTPAAGGQDVYYARSWTLLGEWTAPQNLVSVNTAGMEQRSTLSADGKRLYFGRDGDIFESERIRD
jgi:hypothetical protein